MKHYHVYINGEQVGPMSLEKLKELHLTPSTLIWYNGLPEWIEASRVEELTEYFAQNTLPPIPEPVYNVPPPINKTQSWLSRQSKPRLYTIAGGSLLCIIILWTFLLPNRKYSQVIIDADALPIDTAKARIMEEEKRIKELEIEEKAHEKINEIKEQEEKNRVKAELTSLYNQKESVEEQIRQLKEEIEAVEYEWELASDELDRVREWQLGRLPSERKQQENRVIRKISQAQSQYATKHATLDNYETNLKNINQKIKQLITRLE